MEATDAHRQKSSEQLRVLFCFGVTQDAMGADQGSLQALLGSLPTTFEDLSGRFGVTVLGTMDDDELMVGSSAMWPWTCYILADVPDIDAVRAVCNLLRDTRVGDYRLWKYMRVEARVGRPLFFGNA